MREHALQFFRRGIGKAKTSLHLPGLKLFEGFKHLQNRMLQMREKLSQKAQNAAVKMQEALQWVADRPQVFLGWGQAQLQRLSPQHLFRSAALKSRFQTSEKFAHRATDWICTQFNHGMRGIKKRCVEPVVNFYIQQLQRPWQQVKNICKGSWQSTRDFFHQKHRRAYAFFQEKKEKLKHLSSLHLIHYLTSHPWMSRLPLRLQHWLKRFLALAVVRAVCDAGIKVYVFVMHSLLQGATYSLEAFSKAIQMTIRGFDRMRECVKKSSQFILNALQIVQRTIRTFILRALYYSLLFAMMSLIIFMWGIRSLGDLMSALTMQLSFKKERHY